MIDSTTLGEAEQAFVSSLLLQALDPASAVAVAKRLSFLFRRKSDESLETALADAAGTPLGEIAANLRRDLAAVQTSLDLPWTTSPAEGYSNRLQTLKRSMYAGMQQALQATRPAHSLFHETRIQDVGTSGPSSRSSAFKRSSILDRSARSRRHSFKRVG